MNTLQQTPNTLQERYATPYRKHAKNLSEKIFKTNSSNHIVSLSVVTSLTLFFIHDIFLVDEK